MELVKRIRDKLECGLHRAVEIERGLRVVGLIERAKAFGSDTDLCDALRDMALDQYRIRDFDMSKIAESKP
ncbi:hypothetical protein CQ13_06270 [Bradyrhizobium retamae]|uniref:Uncharacterized protein n=2 Tax=Bradyrhizobium retamae TaxID=1300035 RepID=A0A0R3MN47_9BRAD|nr:hypothetical protein CQ13_06270 [Bradyrhizobium retamae]